MGKKEGCLPWCLWKVLAQKPCQLLLQWWFGDQEPTPQWTSIPNKSYFLMIQHLWKCPTPAQIDGSEVLCRERLTISPENSKAPYREQHLEQTGKLSRNKMNSHSLSNYILWWMSKFPTVLHVFVPQSHMLKAYHTLWGRKEKRWQEVIWIVGGEEPQ